MRKIIIGILVLLVLVGSVFAADLIVFSGTVSGDGGDTIGGSVTSCGNGVCNEWESYDNCPEDCKIEYYFNEPILDYSITSGISNDNYSNGWLFRFELDFYHPSPVYFGFKMDDFTDGSEHTIPIDGNTRIAYFTNTFDVDIFDIGNEYVYIDTRDLFDASGKDGIQATVNIEVKLPIDTYPTSYVSNYYWEFKDEN